MLVREPSVSGDVATTATAAATVTVAAREAQSEGGEASGAAAAGMFGSSNSGEDDKTRVLDGGFGGNRWPRQETLALLKIRSEMDIAFRDSSVKGPLWDEVSRKLGELGYNRSAKKCKEKFENVFKYHKRTKDGRISKGQGKTYRFFDQLEAFHHHHHHHHQSPPLKPQPPVAAAAAAAVSIAMPAGTHPATTVPSTSTPTTTHITSTTIPSFPSSTNPTNYPSQSNIPPSIHNISTDPLSNSTSSSSSSSTSSDLELEGGRGKRKRKWKEFFERMMKEVVDKQEELQKKFLEAIEKREHERMVREEAWRMQEMTRINREREILAQERSTSATKDAAVMAFLQKLADQQNAGTGSGQVILPKPAPTPTLIQSQPPPPPQPQSQPQPKPLSSEPAPPQPVFSMEIVKRDKGSSSRWPKVEVEALISVRKNLDTKYQENGPKGALWEEISAGMRRLGYNRSSKRCKEKWENINKYFKKVKESNKKRPEDSKTCPYFHQLDALYREKNNRVHDISASNQLLFKPENSVPLMVQPEQQWPPSQPDEGMEDVESDQNVEEDDKDGDEEEEEEEDVGIVPNKQVNSMNANE